MAEARWVHFNPGAVIARSVICGCEVRSKAIPCAKMEIASHKPLAMTVIMTAEQ